MTSTAGLTAGNTAPPPPPAAPLPLAAVAAATATGARGTDRELGAAAPWTDGCVDTPAPTVLMGTGAGIAATGGRAVATAVGSAAGAAAICTGGKECAAAGEGEIGGGAESDVVMDSGGGWAAVVRFTTLHSEHDGPLQLRRT